MAAEALIGAYLPAQAHTLQNGNDDVGSAVAHGDFAPQARSKAIRSAPRFHELLNSKTSLRVILTVLQRPHAAKVARGTYHGGWEREPGSFAWWAVHVEFGRCLVICSRPRRGGQVAPKVRQAAARRVRTPPTTRSGNSM